MTTTVIIPYIDNKESSILHLFKIVQSAVHLKLDDVKIKLDEFRDGKDINFDIPNNDLPNILRQISDDGFVYKPEHLKKLESDHLSTIHSYHHINHQDYTAEISVILYQTTNREDSISVIDTSLTTDEKAQLISSIETVLQTVPKKETRWDIGVIKVSCSVSLTPEILHYIGQQWTRNYFKV